MLDHGIDVLGQYVPCSLNGRRGEVSGVVDAFTQTHNFHPPRDFMNGVLLVTLDDEETNSVRTTVNSSYNGHYKFLSTGVTPRSARVGQDAGIAVPRRPP